MRAVSDGGDDSEWLGEALTAVGLDESLRAVGAVRAERGEAHIGSLPNFSKT